MADEAHEWTDGKIAELEKRLRAEYDQAAKEMLKKHEHYLKVYGKAKAKIDDLEASGAVTAKEAKDMRMRYMLQEGRMRKMAEDYAADAVNAGKKATEIINDALPTVMAENYNWGTFDLERQAGVDTAFTLVSEDTVRRLVRDNPDLLPDVTFDGMAAAKINGQRFTSAITQGVLQGESIPNIAKRIRSVTGMSANASVRAARTACTSAESAGREEAYKRAEDLGIKLGRRWIATHDNRTRTSHRLVDGEVRKTGEKYSNGLLFPGDPAGPPEEVLNCRCRTAGSVEGFEPLEETYKRLYGKKAGYGFLTFDQDPSEALRLFQGYMASHVTTSQAIQNYGTWKAAHQGPAPYHVNQQAQIWEDASPQFIAKAEECITKADPEVRLVWERYEASLRVAESNRRAGAYAAGDGIHLNLANTLSGSRGENAMDTWFHEHGHFMDHLSYYRDKGRSPRQGGGIMPKSSKWTAKNGKTLGQTAKDEVQAILDAKKAAGKAGYKAAIAAKDLDWLYEYGVFNRHEISIIKRYGGDSYFSSLPKNYSVNFARKSVERDIYKLPQQARTAVSDIVDGATESKIQDGWRHGRAYWQGNPDNLSNEIVADIMGAEMTVVVDSGNLEAVKKMLPETYKAFREFLEEL